MRRLPVLISAVLAASGMALAFAVGGGAQAPAAGTTIQLAEKEVSSTNIDNPPDKFSQGDEFVFESKLTDPATGNSAGKDGGYCVIIHAARKGGSAQCSVTLFLSGGTIAVDGGVRFAKTFSLPVVGGTGTYEGARGSVLIEDLKGGRSNLTVHLLP